MTQRNCYTNEIKVLYFPALVNWLIWAIMKFCLDIIKRDKFYSYPNFWTFLTTIILSQLVILDIYLCCVCEKYFFKFVLAQNKTNEMSFGYITNSFCIILSSNFNIIIVFISVWRHLCQPTAYACCWHGSCKLYFFILNVLCCRFIKNRFFLISHPSWF